MHTAKKQYEMDMCSGSILKKMLLFTLPLMLSSILQLLFNAADIVVVGKFAGDNALAAVGSNTALINLLTNLFVGFRLVQMLQQLDIMGQSVKKTWKKPFTLPLQ